MENIKYSVINKYRRKRIYNKCTKIRYKIYKTHSRVEERIQVRI